MDDFETLGNAFLDHSSTGDLELAIAKGVAQGYFSQTSAIGLFEASLSSANWQANLNDERLMQKLKLIQADPGDAVRTRTFFIPWATYDRQFAITPGTLSAICSVFDVPLPLIEAVLDVDYLARWPGNGLFMHKTTDGRLPSKLEFFYRYCYGLSSGRSFIFTRYDFTSGVTTNICFSCIPDVKTRWVANIGARVGLSAFEQPLALHSLLLSRELHCWSVDGMNARSELLEDENDLRVIKPKDRATKLHRLTRVLHMLVEDFNDLEERICFLLKVSERFSKALHLNGNLEDSEADKDILEFLLSKSKYYKRWFSNYRDRANIRINLAFHLSTQVDNELNLQISKATTAIARDAQQDSSSMITLAAVTMFFLPGTFISAVFSMVFFNFQQDSDGNQELQVSDRWWYFLAATIPLTCVVFVIWIVWQRIRFNNHQMEEESSNKLSDDAELDFLNAGGETMPVDSNNFIRRMHTRMISKPIWRRGKEF